MDYRNKRRSRVALYIPMPPYNLREQMKQEGFILPKVARELVEREVKYPFGWYDRASRQDKQIRCIFDEGGVERYRYRNLDVGVEPLFEALGQRYYYNHNGNGENSGMGISRNSIDIPTYGTQPRVKRLTQVGFTSFSVSKVQSSRD